MTSSAAQLTTFTCMSHPYLSSSTPFLQSHWPLYRVPAYLISATLVGKHTIVKLIFQDIEKDTHK